MVCSPSCYNSRGSFAFYNQSPGAVAWAVTAILRTPRTLPWHVYGILPGPLRSAEPHPATLAAVHRLVGGGSEWYRAGKV